MRKGFTLVELLIVMTILVMMGVMMIGIFNPKLQMNKANDATRKKDIGRIKVAFEEYFNDTGCYPSDTNVRFPNMWSNLMNKANCNTGIFGSWGLDPWPCDPVARVPYYVFVEQKDCPSWFKILTNLSNKADSQIPVGWYVQGSGYTVGGNLNTSQVNFGVSSPNILWYDRNLGPDCVGHTQCFGNNSGGWIPLGPGQFCNPGNPGLPSQYTSLATGPDNSCMSTCCDNGQLCSGSICH
jgi:prepilin-type N-terminal cleavage/methylation domain-containing protein